ncbi:MAG: cytochrome B6 [Proteobacteria bacterium]|nr:cytochrome B6 [Pseudomonadota bacterium]
MFEETAVSRIHGLTAALFACFALTAAAAEEDFSALTKRLQLEKPKFAQRQQALLAERYDLADRPARGAAMSRGKPVQDGVRVRLPKGMAWGTLAALAPEEIKARQLWPAGFLPLPQGKLVTLGNFNELFKDILNPKQLEGLRLLVTPFPQQQFNATEDRRSLKAHQGVACFDCHANGHANGATHTVGDIRPNEHRHRIDTPSLRGVNIQRLFGSQRAIKTMEDFTEFEQRGAYFDGIPADATRKGTNILERASQVHFMAELQALLDFPPAPKLDIFGKLNVATASENEMRGQQVFFGKGRCAACHTPPYYTDNLMHNLKVERFFKEVTINGRKASADGPIKTFPLRGIKDSPPYLHDGRLLTLADTVEFFNLVLELKLNELEKQDLVAFMQAL